MTRFLEFSSDADAKAFVAKMDAKMGYPNPKTKTERYTMAVKHPSGKRWVCAVDAGEQPKLAALEKDALKTPATTAEFFPVEPA